VRAALREREGPRSTEVNEALTGALGGSVPARAAYAVVKNGTLALMAETGERPTGDERAELVAAALRALG
jgi:hypothetical protein